MLFDIFNEDWAQTFSSLEDIIWFLILYLIFLLVMAIFLKIALSLFSSARHTEFGSVFVITVIYALTFLFLSGWVAWVIVLIVAWLIISARHHTGVFGAIGVTIVAFILYFIVAILLGILLGVTLIVLPF